MSMSQEKSEFMAKKASLQIERRIKALQKLQLEFTYLESNFYKEVHALECKYSNLYSPIYEKRFKVVAGDEPIAGGEGDLSSDSDGEYDQCLVDNVMSLRLPDVSERPGLPGFWFSVLRNVDMISELIQIYDEPILIHLVNITVTLNEVDPMGFTLGFHFEPNEYFTDAVLTKEYLMKCDVDEDEPFTFDGPEIRKCRGCVIHWNEGMDVTVKAVLKEQKSKENGKKPEKTVDVPVASFFNFFDPPFAYSVSDALGTLDLEHLSADFEIGHIIRERIVPRAIWYYTGEALNEPVLTSEDEEEDDEFDSEYSGEVRGIEEDN